MVYVISKDGKPLMPCTNVIARLLLKSNKAKCIRRTPFTIKLNYTTTEYTQDLTLGIDTGSGKIGSAVVSENKKVIYVSEVEVRNNITDKMDARRKYRRNRRNRKTRYRKARWLNRGSSKRKDRLPPTVTSKINSHLKEIKFVKSLLPITDIVLETAKFDPHLMKNPRLHNELYKKWGYQKGKNYGFSNTKSYVLNRDKYTCQKCKKKSGICRLEVHHIIFRSNGGSDEEENLITLCEDCHKGVHAGKITLSKVGKSKSQLKHATQMNIIRTRLLEQVRCVETFGYITKENRQSMNLPKEHSMDAVAIASGGEQVKFNINALLLKKCISKGDYQQTKGIRSQMKIPTGKIRGFRKFDKVRYLGKEYFIKGRRSSGTAELMNIDNQKVEFKDAPKGCKTPKMDNMKRIQARKSWIMKEEIIQNIC